MHWESFYLTCFLIGLLLSIVSLVLGGHFHLPVHLPHALHIPHFHAAHGDHGDGTSPFNLTSILMFLTWFGATGYLMTHFRSAAAGVVFTAAVGVGFVGGALMYLFLARVLIANERPLRDADFEMTGVLGHVSSPIREAGTGELIYTQQGTRRSCGARSEDGAAIERGTEVVVMRVEKGIAYVRRFDELSRENG
jgi:membrane protein implicated in regulation of membrane protease activity